MELLNELQLSEFEITGKSISEDGQIIYNVVPVAKPDKCPKCGSSVFVSFGNCDRWVRDMPLYDKNVYIMIQGKRYKCSKCGSTFNASYESVDDRGKITKRLKENIKQRSLTQGLTELAEQYGISVSTVKTYRDEYIGEMMAQRVSYVPNILGLIQTDIGKKTRVLCVDMQENLVVEILENNSRRAISEYLTTVTSGHNPEFIIEFDETLYNILIAECPGSDIVIDKFYVVNKILSATLTDIGRIGNNDLKTALLTNYAETTDEQKALLNKAFRKDSRLKIIHDTKEGLINLYSEPTISGATNKLKQIKSSLEMPCALAECCDLMLKYADEIFEYLYLEGFPFNAIRNAERGAKNIERKDAGCSFEVLRAKLLLGKGKKVLKKTIKKPIYKPTSESKDYKGYMYMQWPITNEIIGYEEEEIIIGWGVDIDALLEDE